MEENLLKRKLTNEEEKSLMNFIVSGKNEEAKNLIKLMDYVDNEIEFSQKDLSTLLTLSCRFENIEIVKYLIELGSDVNRIDNCDYSLLMTVSLFRYVEIARVLVGAGADLNFVNSSGESALSISVSNNDEVFMEFIISSAGADVEKCGGMALVNSVHNGRKDILERLIEVNANINFVDSQGWTLLHYACSKDHLDILTFLLDCGVDENIQNNFGKYSVDLTKNEEIIKAISDRKPTKFVLK